MNKEIQEEDREFEEPQRPVDPPQEKNPHKRKLAWVREIIQGAERYGAPEENHRERKRTRPCFRYVALLCDFIDKEPSSYEEAEAEAPRIRDTIMNEEAQEEDREFEEPQRPIDPPLEKNPHKRKPAWVREAIQGAERYGAPE